MQNWTKLRILILMFLTVAPGGAVSGVAQSHGGSAQFLDSEDHRWVEQTLKQLSLDEKIGQMLLLRVYGDYRSFNSSSYLAVADQIRRYHVGSVDLASRMSGPNLSKGTPAEVATIINQLQRETKIPLLVGADIERGLASRVSGVAEFPFPMAFGAVGDPKLVEQFALISAREARAVGIQWAFAPVADVNSNPSNPIINVRSYGEDPQKVGKFVAAYIRGAHKGGLIVSVKHFPGHGDSATDSHLGVVQVNSDRRHLDAIELPPFREAIAVGADSVLLAHAAVPALDPDEHRITTNSPKIMTGLLREQMGFQGLVVTDALEMRGLLSIYPNDPNPDGHAAVDAIKAGADVLMLPKELDATFNAIVEAVHKQEISESRLDASVRRILELKANAGLNKSRFVNLKHVEEMFPDSAANELAQRVADESVTLVRSNGHALPVLKSDRKETSSHVEAGDGLVVVSFVDSNRSRIGPEFDRQIKLRRPNAKMFHFYNDKIGSDADPAVVLPSVKQADQVVIAAFVSHVPGRQVISRGALRTAVGLSGEGSDLIRRIIETAPDKTTLVALGSPYLIEDYPKAENYICTYSLATTTEVSAAKALFGEIQNHAKLPVTLPGIATSGSAVAWPAVVKNAEN